jgi:hypothetical protein
VGQCFLNGELDTHFYVSGAALFEWRVGHRHFYVSGAVLSEWRVGHVNIEEDEVKTKRGGVE